MARARHGLAALSLVSLCFVGCSDRSPAPPAAVAVAPATPSAAAGSAETEAYARRLEALANEDTQGATQAMRASSMSRRDAVSRLVTMADRLYGGPLPIYISYSRRSDELPGLLAAAGCTGERFAAPELGSRDVRPFLDACPPHGPRLLSYVRPDDQASVGMASLALIAESRASAEVRDSELHHALMAGLLSNGPPVASP